MSNHPTPLAPLMAWPKLAATCPIDAVATALWQRDYERARYEAAMQRLRVAIEALTAVGYVGSLVTAEMQRRVCKHALATIDLPTEGA